MVPVILTFILWGALIAAMLFYAYKRGKADVAEYEERLRKAEEQWEKERAEDGPNIVDWDPAEVGTSVHHEVTIPPPSVGHMDDPFPSRPPRPGSAPKMPGPGRKTTP